MDSYCVFITSYLDINVVSDFRSRKTTPYYDTQDPTQFVEGMKIIPLDTGVLKHIVSESIKYRTLYRLFHSAYESTLPPHLWYNNFINTIV